VCQDVAMCYDYRSRRMHKQSYYGYLTSTKFDEWCDRTIGHAGINQPAVSSSSSSSSSSNHSAAMSIDNEPIQLYTTHQANAPSEEFNIQGIDLLLSAMNLELARMHRRNNRR